MTSRYPIVTTRVMKSGTDGENCHEISYFLSLTTFKSCESRDNEIVTDILTTPNTLRENSHGCHEIVNTLRDSVVTIVTDRIVTVCFDPR